MKKLVRIIFEYEDGSSDKIIDPLAAALFQSRCNSSGFLSGIGNYLIEVKRKKRAAK